MQFIDLKSQYKLIKSDILKSIENVLDHGQYIMGPEVNLLENKLANYVGSDYCVSCSSGTDALLMALMAFEVGPGDAVFTTPFTFVATAEVISLLGATPVFVDIDEDTYNISPELLDEAIQGIIYKKSLNPKVIIPVDLFGLPADYNKIQNIAIKYDLQILEDGAQSFGGKIGNQKACSFGDISTTSFFPAKPLGGYGDGGAIFTNDNILKEKMESIRVHGKGSDKYNNIRIGINGRLDSIQAAILLEKLTIFNEEIKNRQKVSELYSSQLKDTFVVPFIPEGYASAWAQYSILANDKNHREECMDMLKNKGIPSAIYYPIPLHLQQAYKNLGYSKGDFSICESVSKRIFSLPMHPYLSEDEINQITSLLNNLGG